MDAEQRLKIIIQQYKAGIRRCSDALDHVMKLNNDYLRNDGLAVLYDQERYLCELEDELFRVRKEKAR